MFSFKIKHNFLKKKLINQGKVQSLLILNLNNDASTQQNEEYQYIKKSEIPTMYFQSSLPRLPIPKLHDTCMRYLKAQKPLLSAKQLDKTTSYVYNFMFHDGYDIQKQLLQTNAKNSHTSYISELWFDTYLRDRKPLPINYNPFIVFALEDNSLYNMQLVKATNLIISSLRFMKSLKENVLPPEVFHVNPKKTDTKLFYMGTKILPSKYRSLGASLLKAYPLDMSQYHNLFNTTRLPKVEKDEIYQDASARHVVVMRRGYIYSFDVLDKNGYIIEPNRIATCLKSILEDNRPANKSPVGVLTTSERSLWANTRAYLSQIGNQEVLQKIDSAILMMILDDDYIGSDYNKLVRTYLHADGTNRWFDKSLSLIVTQDGYAGVNFEHSWGDGVAVLRFFNDLKDDISKQPKFNPNDVDYLKTDRTNIEKLEFVIDDKIQNIIDTEKRKYEEWTKQLSIDHIICNDFGKDDCKNIKVSPDAIMQLAFQLALYYKQGDVVPTYESCSTAAFKHGRTEAIRSCTMETKAACEAIVSNKMSAPDLKELIVKCSDVHSELTRDAAMGQGFDRHLFALKKIWEQSDFSKDIQIFKDPSYEYINNNILSTSTLSSPAVFAGGFGPVVNNGYGIGYMIQDKRLGAVVTSYNYDCNANEYVKYLEQAFKRIWQALTNRW